MLVLTRLKNGVITIGENVVITVIEIQGDRVKIGVSAPPDVQVHRGEIYEKIHGRKPERGFRGSTD